MMSSVGNLVYIINKRFEINECELINVNDDDEYIVLCDGNYMIVDRIFNTYEAAYLYKTLIDKGVMI